jgi:membrane-associated protease RseP (regulator of RpoE activity)
MLKRVLIGLGITVGVLAACLVLLTTGAVVGGAIAYLTAHSLAGGALPELSPEATMPPDEYPQPLERPWQWPQPSPEPREWPQPTWGFLQPALVTEIVEDSPAEESGVETGDIIIGIDGTALDADHDLAEVIREHDPGDEVKLTIIRRDGDTAILEVEVTLGRERDEDGEIVAYLGLWYRPLGSGMGFMVPEGDTWD